MTRIEKINIENIGPIKELMLRFNPNMNVICGKNGIGKTTILDCLAQSFAPHESTIKKTSGKEKGQWSVDVLVNSKQISRDFEVDHFHPNEKQRKANGLYENSNDVIVFKTHRDIPYKKLTSLETGKQKTQATFGMETMSGSLSNDLKNWFVSRFLFAAQAGSLDEGQLNNFQLAKKCFSLLNPKVSFSRVLPNSFDILINTEYGEIYLEYLSSGYKSCLAVLLGIIHEVELRYSNPSKFIGDFDGLIFIDEIDLHLHPEWQANIYYALKFILPNAQIFTSTHSPHIIQVADPSEIIALTVDVNNSINVNPMINQEFGCQGWTVEEVLRDVMGMEETRTSVYLDAMTSFNAALDGDNVEEALNKFEVIDRMLHPENSLRKILKIQLAGI